MLQQLITGMALFAVENIVKVKIFIRNHLNNTWTHPDEKNGQVHQSKKGYYYNVLFIYSFYTIFLLHGSSLKLKLIIKIYPCAVAKAIKV